jgi:hypothetical protein
MARLSTTGRLLLATIDQGIGTGAIVTMTIGTDFTHGVNNRIDELPPLD